MPNLFHGTGLSTPDPYISSSVMLQVRVDLQLHMHSFVAVCRVLQSALNTKRIPLGLARNRKTFVRSHNTAGFASDRFTSGVGKIWERLSAPFPDPLVLALEDCIPYPFSIMTGQVRLEQAHVPPPNARSGVLQAPQARTCRRQLTSAHPQPCGPVL